jgi:glycosyltransferase involved in cell wall biosynthesis
MTPDDEAERVAAKRRLSIPPHSVLLSLFGFVVPYKGYGTALEALSLLPESFHLAIVGGRHPHSDHSAFEEVYSLIDHHPELDGRVWVTGYVPAEELLDYQLATDVCLAPYDELPGFSSSAALSWALASGRPVIASRLPAFAELQEEAGCVWLAPPGAPHELAHEIEQLCGDPALRAQLAERARAYAAANSWKDKAREHVELYETLLGASPSPRRRLALPADRPRADGRVRRAEQALQRASSARL